MVGWTGRSFTVNNGRATLLRQSSFEFQLGRFGFVCGGLGQVAIGLQGGSSVPF